MGEIDPRLRVAEYGYELPEGLIAQAPLAERDASRMLVLDRSRSVVHHAGVADLPTWLEPGDLLVVNNSRVLPARLMATKVDTGGEVELLLLRPAGGDRWEALAKPARRLRPGMRLSVAARGGKTAAAPAEVEVVEVQEDGRITVAIGAATVERLDAYGETPLPPYIKAANTALDSSERYQTIYGSALGSAAAPTAGLHFSEGLVERLRRAGIGWAEITLHVGVDTFRPMTSDRVAEHRIHREWYEVSDETARAVARTRANGRRVVAVGTTAARTLETLGGSWCERSPRGRSGETDLFITPGYRWRMVDAMLTNFHVPHSTLLLMVSSFAGWPEIKRAYRMAIAERYRFFSFGDAMLIV